MEHLDKLAEVAVKEAIAALVAGGKRPNSGNVPPEAERLLKKKGRERMPDADAKRRVQQAIDRLRERREIKASREPHSDWGLIEYEPQPTSPKPGEP